MFMLRQVLVLLAIFNLSGCVWSKSDHIHPNPVRLNVLPDDVKQGLQ